MTKLTDEQRIARALRAAELEESRPALPSHLQAARARTLDARAKMYGRKVYAPRARKVAAAEKYAQIDRAVEQLRAELSMFKRLTWTQIAVKLWGEQHRYFPNGIPYSKRSKFDREVRMALSRWRQKQQTP